MKCLFLILQLRLFYSEVLNFVIPVFNLKQKLQTLKYMRRAANFAGRSEHFAQVE